MKSTTFIRFFTIGVFVLLFSTVRAFHPGDRMLLSALKFIADKKPTLNKRKNNTLVFPDRLAEHESKSIDYIEKFSSARRGYLIRTYNRSKKVFPKINTILKKYQIPKEFCVLLALESGFNPNAVSSAGAVGYWQIMDQVALEFGLKIIPNQHKLKTQPKQVVQNAGKKLPADDRKNLTKSTHAAAKYLRDRYRNLNGDILLVAASYNWGVGNVWNAMKRSGKTNPSFWDIKKYLPEETKAYVMNFITLNVIFNNFENFNNQTISFRKSLEQDNKSSNCCERAFAQSDTF